MEPALPSPLRAGAFVKMPGSRFVADSDVAWFPGQIVRKRENFWVVVYADGDSEEFDAAKPAELRRYLVREADVSAEEKRRLAQQVRARGDSDQKPQEEAAPRQPRRAPSASAAEACHQACVALGAKLARPEYARYKFGKHFRVDGKNAIGSTVFKATSDAIIEPVGVGRGWFEHDAGQTTSQVTNPCPPADPNPP